MITCDDCNGSCCRKLVVEIDTPRNKDDFEDIKWYLYHPGVSIYIDMNDKWNVQFNSQCSKLDKDGRCSIYEKRPPVCKNAKVKDCEMNKPDVKIMFKTLEDYKEFIEAQKI